MAISKTDSTPVSSTPVSSQGNDTLQLTVEVVFYFRGETFSENFPNNSSIEHLVNFAEGKLNLKPIKLKSRENGKQFEGAERLMDLMPENSEGHQIEVDVEPLHRRLGGDRMDVPVSDEETLNQPIPATAESDECTVASALAEKTLQ
ncbi:uncharacterized protein LOC133190613 [Saccostrea echinata]|uniref:uncharacterized protein LOC133190613 n=1 Tax=Saccostrea echinata TaxID=191078 RepID=UPI002A82E17F|nr:uncharacterized protein LOC133190613 [Saccostrea echinata]